MTRTIVLLLAFFSLAAASRADDFPAAVEADQVLITVDADSGGKQISAVSRSLDWNVILLGEERAHVHLRVPIGSFESDHKSLDAMVREAAGWTRHGTVDIEGEVAGDRFTGVLSVGGRSRLLVMSVEIARAGEQIVAHAKFRIDLRDFGIAVSPLDGSAAVEFVARLHASPGAVVSGGSWRGS